MRRCSKCRNTGHDRRNCNKKTLLKRKNTLTISDIISISIKETPVQKETPLSTRPRCRSCGDLAAALIAKLKNGQNKPLQWSDNCLSCHGQEMIDKYPII